MTLNRLLYIIAAALFLVAALLGFGVFNGAHLLGWIAAGLLASAVAKIA